MRLINTRPQMGQRARARSGRDIALCCALAYSAGTTACRPSDVLSVSPPVGVQASGAYQSQAGAEAAFDGAMGGVFDGLAGAGGLVQWANLLGDEFAWGDFTRRGGRDANIDARVTVGALGGFQESGDVALERLMSARSALLVVLPSLRQYEPAVQRANIGKALALIGYTELFLAEDYCAGVPLSQVLPGGGIQFGTPLTTDSLLATAEAHFDTALANANSDPAVQAMASVGLGRARLDRGRYAAAAAAVANVPTNFVYNTELEPSFNNGPPYEINLFAAGFPANGCPQFGVADRKGNNGVNFVSAADPRLIVDSTLGLTCGRTTWYYPAKFGVAVQTYVPLATGAEARLIEAEAALAAGVVGTWATDLNAIRANAPSTYLASDSGFHALTSDSTTGATPAMQVDVMFRERAFWLYGTGTRLGDLRRLIRQYGRDQSTVFPTGPYPNGQSSSLPAPLPSYGTDVNLTLPTAKSFVTTANPQYKGCLTSTKTA